MALSLPAIREADSMVEKISRKIWIIPASFPKTWLNALLDDLGLNFILAWEDYCSAAIRSWTQIPNDEGALARNHCARLPPTGGN
jgi:hypothetical protein